ncbi:FMN-binding negative transcriptional regulator [Chitinophaga sp. GCM10012297]|uniref:FMN-binding negative transcriptional regulator n=1 Tax=Chitinophaga chungangae TaxID=2821488 RepID=A0ABS3Y9P7_9BACT|nr:FMN-binding negative transcriptional regulator [Chitinophaga chungangae]MBO9151210.1 FMN-binding negative transcriptional regulator [Chitinophaga chungangae]
MYAPRLHQEQDWETIAAFIHRHSFALLISVQDGLPTGTHLPVELAEKSPGEFVLRGHIANANTQAAAFTSGQTFLTVFSDPHAYISSSWYEKDKIPTWNYIAVHVYGTLRIQSENELIESLGALMNKYEAASRRPVTMSDIGEKEIRNNLKAITGFEIAITRIDTRFKLSQNKSDKDYASVVQHLQQHPSSGAQEIAAEMIKRRS